MKTAEQRKIEKLEEIARHIGLQDNVPFIEALRNTKCPKCSKYADEIAALDKEIEQSDDLKCPKCESKNIATRVIYHNQCVDCRVRFMTDTNGNKLNSVTLDSKTPTKAVKADSDKRKLPKSFKELFRCLQDGCYEINFYGKDDARAYEYDEIYLMEHYASQSNGYPEVIDEKEDLCNCSDGGKYLDGYYDTHCDRCKKHLR